MLRTVGTAGDHGAVVVGDDDRRELTRVESVLRGANVDAEDLVSDADHPSDRMIEAVVKVLQRKCG